MAVFVIAEAGVNHNGQLDLAIALVEAAAAAGADAVKFQTFDADSLVAKGTATVAYQSQSTGEADQHAMIRKLELSREGHEATLRRSKELGIEFMSTGFDADSVRYLVDLGVKRLKVPSGEITNLPFLRDVASYGLPVIVSTGMADLAEVRRAVETIDAVRPRMPDNLCVLHCTSAYPTPDEDVNLDAMDTMRRELGVPVGYSDHTVGIFAASIAVAMGAEIIEKHFTLDRNLPGPDHEASLEPGELGDMIANIRRIERIRGDGVKAARPSELEARRLVRRGIKAARPIEVGHQFTAADFVILRPAEGIAPAELDRVIGRRASRAIPVGAAIGWDMVE